MPSRKQYNAGDEVMLGKGKFRILTPGIYSVYYSGMDFNLHKWDESGRLTSSPVLFYGGSLPACHSDDVEFLGVQSEDHPTKP